MSDTKECLRCHQVMALDCFYKSSKGILGHTSYCKNCDREKRKENYLANKDRDTAKKKLQKEKPSARYTECKYNAKARNLPFSLTLEAFTTLTQLPCEYCGTTQDRRGIDRSDSTIGYELTNCYPCCWTCNKMKNDTPTADWLLHMHKILTHKNLIH